MLLFGDADNPSNGFYEVLGAEKIYGMKADFQGASGWSDLYKLAQEC